MQELSNIALQITEPQYRQMPELSYSTLSTYERTGYNGIEHLFDKKESPSLLFGSCVDAILTGGEDEFNSLFFVAEIPSIGDKEKQIADYLFINYGGHYIDIQNIPATYILEAINAFDFQKNWRDETRVKVVIERTNEYYSVKVAAKDKTVITRQLFDEVCNCVRALRTAESTRHYFADNDEFSPIKRYYQLKFRADIEGVGYRCMADLIVVNYEEKKIYPIDLKTSSHCEWDFPESFLQWNYMIQSRLYWSIIRQNLDKDEFFKDFELMNYRFIVVNKKTLTPLVWEFPYTTTKGTLIDNKGNLYRDPTEIGKELRAYLDCKPPVPKGINLVQPNMINCLKPI